MDVIFFLFHSVEHMANGKQLTDCIINSFVVYLIFLLLYLPTSAAVDPIPKSLNWKDPFIRHISGLLQSPLWFTNCGHCLSYDQ